MTLHDKILETGHRVERTTDASKPVRRDGAEASFNAQVSAGVEAGPHLNRAIGFTSLLIGVASGMIIGLWSFGGPLPVPDGIGEYSDLPRRFLRLGHIAFFGLGLINLAIAGHCGCLNFGLAARQRSLTLINLGNVGLPPLLLAAAWQPVLLYLMPVPVLCVFAALALAAAAAWRSPPQEAL